MVNGHSFCKVTVEEVFWLDTLPVQGPFQYAFAYNISIKNISPSIVLQILSRKWVIKDGDQKDRIVIGSRVVGQTPVLYPDDVFAYQSYLTTINPFGEAFGSYYGVFTKESEMKRFITPDNRQVLGGERFTIEIPRFSLTTSIS